MHCLYNAKVSDVAAGLGRAAVSPGTHALAALCGLPWRQAVRRPGWPVVWMDDLRDAKASTH